MTNWRKEHLLADFLLDEACRQWCDGIEDAPERLSGKGFSDFFRQIVADKRKEYDEEAASYLRNQGEL
ncbi:hypothetical protein NBH08_27975 [Faecalicatena sp. BF-R-105]|nr:hypothetical protein [Faecalicatena sp. BF-R-105]